MWCLKATQTVSHPSLHNRVQWAIINAQKKMNFLNGFTLRMWNFVSSSWFERLRISDRKFVNHTTEMILWSMILEWLGSYKNVGLLKRLRDCWAKYSFFKKCPWDYGIFSAFARKSFVKQLLRFKNSKTVQYLEKIWWYFLDNVSSMYSRAIWLVFHQPSMQKNEKENVANSTQCSQAVSHPSTN